MVQTHNIYRKISRCITLLQWSSGSLSGGVSTAQHLNTLGKNSVSKCGQETRVRWFVDDRGLQWFLNGCT